MDTTLRRRKHWGWGYEDQQPALAELREAGAGIRAHLGFEPADVEQPVPLEALELPPPRL
jgi:alkyldihydroxyacetonephosphate synthase